MLASSRMTDLAGYLTLEYGKHPRAHNVRPYGIFMKFQTHFSAY